MLESAGIALALLAAPLSRVTQAQYARLTHRLRDELWGLCSRSVPPGAFAQTCRLLVGCRTLGEALEIGLRQYRLLIDDFTPRLQRRALWSASAWRRGGLSTPRWLMRNACSAFWPMGWPRLPGRRIPLLSVNYPASMPGPVREAALVFRAPVQCGGQRMAWTFGAGCLELPVVRDARSLSAF